MINLMGPRFNSRFRLPHFFCFALLFTQLGIAKPVGVYPNSIPVNGTFIAPPALLFTPFPSAACINAAALPSTDSMTTLQLAYSPSRGETPQNIFSGIATSTKSFGVGFGYFGSLGKLKTTNGGFAGFGFKSNLSQYGFGYRNADITSNGQADFDLSYLYTDAREGLSYGGVLRGFTSSPQLNLGIGYMADRFFNVEFNVNAPKVRDLSNGDFTLIGASNFSVSEKIVVHLQLNYHTQTSKLDTLSGFNYWLSDVANAVLQFSSPNVWSLGFSLIF